MHLIQRPEYGGGTLSFDGELAATELCDQCLPSLWRRLDRRRVARARAVAASIAADVPRDAGGE